jgi:hypothetical protein
MFISKYILNDLTFDDVTNKLDELSNNRSLARTRLLARYLNLCYKKRRQLKIFLIQTRPTIPLMLTYPSYAFGSG